jgi:hypothetical protein
LGALLPPGLSICALDIVAGPTLKRNKNMYSETSHKYARGLATDQQLANTLVTHAYHAKWLATEYQILDDKGKYRLDSHFETSKDPKLCDQMVRLLNSLPDISKYDVRDTILAWVLPSTIKYSTTLKTVDAAISAWTLTPRRVANALHFCNEYLTTIGDNSVLYGALIRRVSSYGRFSVKLNEIGAEPRNVGTTRSTSDANEATDFTMTVTVEQLIDTLQRMLLPTASSITRGVIEPPLPLGMTLTLNF